ncbi:ester cyclase [Aquimarina algicola]|uniref:Ester cyclase n=2 Tax=Aquimarina algicola TaxID=2589995 RepID=A0A504JME3_9FLAO|nr:ester cyclase [Aquimarina algicola]
MVKSIQSKRNIENMKIIVKIALVLVILLSACKDSKKTSIKTNHNPESILQEYMFAWTKHDASEIGSFFDQNVIWYNLPSDTIIKGKSNVTKHITDTFMGNVPDMYWVRSGDAFIDKNTITYEWTYGGTFNGQWGSNIIKNKKFSIKGISTTTINEEGKIIAQKDYYDLYRLQKQLERVE